MAKNRIEDPNDSGFQKWWKTYWRRNRADIKEYSLEAWKACEAIKADEIKKLKEKVEWWENLCKEELIEKTANENI